MEIIRLLNIKQEDEVIEDVNADLGNLVNKQAMDDLVV